MKAVFALVFLVAVATCQPLDLFSNLGNIKKIQSAANRLTPLVKDLLESVHDILETSGKDLGGNAKNIIGELQTTLKDSISNGSSIQDILTTVQGVVKKLNDELGPDVKQVLDKIKEAVEGKIGKISEIVQEIVQIAGNVFGIPKSKLKNIGNAVENAGKGVDNAGHGLQNALESLTGGLNSALGGLFGKKHK